MLNKNRDQLTAELDRCREVAAAALQTVADARGIYSIAFDAERKAVAALAAYEENAAKRFYIQNLGQVGNCLRWWADGGHGYVSDLNVAWKVDEAQARSIIRDRPAEDRAWPVELIDSMAHRHLDVQLLHRAELAGAKPL